MRKIRVYNFEDCEMWIANDYEELSDLSGIHEESFEVIGDIYRNPELLEDKNGK